MYLCSFNKNNDLLLQTIVCMYVKNNITHIFSERTNNSGSGSLFMDSFTNMFTDILA